MTARPYWWAVAHEADIPARRPVAVKVGDLALVLFRDGTGAVAALEDRCAHRRAPLSLGVVTAEGLVQCPYHGWRYEGASGKCRAIPNFSAQEKVPGNFGVRPFATRIVDGFVFVWTGDRVHAESGPAATMDAPVGATTARHARALPCPHAMYAALMLDRPGVLLSIGGIRLLDDFRWGDPRREESTIVSEFGAVWSGNRLDRLPSSPPLTLRVTVAAGTAATHVTLRDEADTMIAAAFLAATPQGAMVTQVQLAGWATDGPRGKPATIGIRPSLDVEAVARTRVAALPDWQALSAV